MGFQEEALSSWKRLLEPGRYLALSELVWFTHMPTQECREYFAHQYPPMVHDEEARRVIRDAGYAILSTFRLPDAAWWDHFYIPLSDWLKLLKAQYPADQEKQALLSSFEEEIEMFCTHSREYGHSFFVARKEQGSHRL